MCGFLCIFRAFPVCVLCSCVFSFLQSLPPPPFFRSNSSRCSNASSILFLVCVFCPVVSVFLVSVPPPFLQPLPLPFLSFLCIRLLTHTLYFPCVPFIPVLFPLFPVAFPSSSSFVPAFSVPCSPLFPLLRFPFRKKFSLKSCMISSVKYMFYSIFLACLWKFS